MIEKYHYEVPAPPKLISFISRQTMNRKILSGVSTFHHTYDVIRKPNFTWFICENIEGDTPLTLVYGNPMPPAQAKYIFFLLTQTLLILHNHLLSLNDWRPDNFVMCNTSIKYMNFSALQTISPASNKDRIFYMGDPRWMSPESLLADSYDMIFSDIWCLGLYLHFMLTGEMLFGDSKTMYSQLKKFQYVVPEGIDSAPAELLSKILVLDPTKRIKLRDILAHRFMLPSVPFPINRVTLERTPQIMEWMEYLEIDIQAVFDKMRALVCDDETLLFCLCMNCIAKGRRPHDFGKSQKVRQEENNYLLNIYIPHSLQMEEEEKKVSFIMPQPSKAKLKAKQKKASLHKLLDVCSSELAKREVGFNHLDAFVEDTIL